MKVVCVGDEATTGSCLIQTITKDLICLKDGVILAEKEKKFASNITSTFVKDVESENGVREYVIPLLEGKEAHASFYDFLGMFSLSLYIYIYISHYIFFQTSTVLYFSLSFSLFFSLFLSFSLSLFFS